MMKFVSALKIGVFIILFLSIYVLANYYVGVRGYKAFGKALPFFTGKLFWILFWAIAFSYMLSMLGRNFLPQFIGNPITTVGVFWMASLFYLILILPVVDLIRFIFHKTPYSSQTLGKSFSFLYSNGLIVFIAVALLILYGAINASRTIVNEYNISIPKKSSSIESLNAVMVSDVHLDSGVNREKLSKMVADINELKPDIIFLCGDILDENTSAHSKEYLPKALKELKSKYGTYAISGNHDYFSEGLEKTRQYFEKGNVTLLSDEALLIDNSFYIIGRNDAAVERVSKIKRKALSDITSERNLDFPIILLDHQPVGVEEAIAAGVNLQLSGHTHNGQFFPNNYITRKIFVKDFGLYEKGLYNLIVSSGYGTWGPPVRIGTKGEIVQINISLK